MTQKLLSCLDELLALLVTDKRFQFARHYQLESSAQSLKEWCDSIRTERNHLTVAIVGEFNSGKSALVNAVYGREVAFSDPFDATMTSATFLPDTSEFVLMFDESGRSTRCTLDDFLAACRRRDLSNVTHAEVHIRTELDLVLADTPGLATIHENHTSRAESTIREADVVVWLIDPQDLLSALEGGFLRRAREIGLLIIPVISKADALTSGEIDECLTALCDTLGFARDQFIHLSAQDHLNKPDGDPGVRRLLTRLHELMADPERTRSQSLDAKQMEVVEQSVRISERLLERLSHEAKWATAEYELILHQQSRLRERLSQTCRIEVQTLLKSHLTSRVPEKVSTDDPDQLCAHCLDGLPEVFATAAERISVRMRKEAHELWRQPFDERSADLEKQIEKLMANAVENQETIAFLSQQLTETKQRQEALTRSINDSGNQKSQVGTSVLEFVGAVVSFFSGSSRPFLASKVGSLLTRLLGVSDKQQPQQLTADECVSSISESLATQMTENLPESIDTYIHAVANDALETLTREKFDGRSLYLIREALDRAGRIHETLRSLNSGPLQ